MGKILVLAEKPSVGRDIARILNCKTKLEGCMEGPQHIVTWCIGHLVQLCEPEEYDIKYKKWSFDTLPVIPEAFKLKVSSKTSNQYATVKKLMHSSDVDSIICATDAGREGELIFRYTYMLAGCKKPFNRLWISSMTDAAIKDGFNSLKSGNEYDNLYLSAKCRSESDWLVGMNASRAFSIKYNSNLSIGRVQTPTLAIIVNRHLERQNFKTEDYYEVRALYDKFTGLWFDSNSKESKIFDKEKAKKISEKIKGKAGTVKDIKNEEKKEAPPQLFDLTELQRTCNRKFGYPASKTLNIVQNLYEKKLVTYPRTDSKYLSKDIVPTLKDRIDAVNSPEVHETIEYIKKNKSINLTKRYVDDTKVSDHHAIIPTEQAPKINSLSPDEKKVYDTIAKRFLAIFLPTYEYTVKSIITHSEGESFISKGKTIQHLGWMSLYKDEKTKKDDEDKSDEQKLPPCSIGDNFQIKDVKIDEKQTKAPPLYTEGTLLSAMENAGKFIEDEELKEQLKDSGLGTPATRAAIIERLIKVGYIVREKKSLVPTEKGINLIEIVPGEIKSPELTGKWEKALSLMAKGQYSTDKFMKSIINYSIFLIDEAKKGKAVEFAKDIKSKYPVGKCPVCGAAVIETSKGWSCSRWKSSGCKFTIWKDDKSLSYYKKKATASMVKSLLKNRRASVKGLINPKTGQKFDRDVVLIQENGYWNIKVDFSSGSNKEQYSDPSYNSTEKSNPPVVTEHVCPSCKAGRLIRVNNDKFKGWSCEKWKDGCRFSVPEEKCGVKLEAYIGQLVQNGETSYIEGFKSQRGNVFSAKLAIKDGKLEMFFKNAQEGSSSVS